MPDVWPSRKGESTQEEYDAFLAETIDEWIKWQEEVGFDVLITVNLSGTTWLSTSVKTCLITSSPKTVRYNHTVCVG